MEEMKFNLSPKQLKASERSVFSQGGQDGILEAIFNQMGHGTRGYFEAGARDGIELSNTANLRINYGWNGFLYDTEPLSSIVSKRHLTIENINNSMDLRYNNELCARDLICLDLDGNDFWILDAITQTPRVILVEYNSKFRNDESVAIEYNPDHKWEGDDYYGASLLAFKKLGEKKGYTLVYVVDRFDAVFVRNDLISTEYIEPTLDELLPEPIIAHEKISNKKWVFV